MMKKANPNHYLELTIYLQKLLALQNFLKNLSQSSEIFDIDANQNLSQFVDRENIKFLR